jgi:hypothetical protein
MRRIVIAALTVAALILPATVSSALGGLSPKQLSDAGWTCFKRRKRSGGGSSASTARPPVSHGLPVTNHTSSFSTSSTRPIRTPPSRISPGPRRRFGPISTGASRARPSPVRTAGTPTCPTSGSLSTTTPATGKRRRRA